MTNSTTIGTVQVIYPPQDSSDGPVWFQAVCKDCDWADECDDEATALTHARDHMDNEHGRLEITDNQRKWLQDARKMIVFLSSHPQFIPSYGGLRINESVYSEITSKYPSVMEKDDNGYEYERIDYSATPLNKAEVDTDVRTQMAKLARALSPCEKSYNEHTFSIVRKFGKHSITMLASRDSVCRKVVVDTKMVEEVDYENAPKKMVEKEVVEWVCDEPLLKVSN